MTDMIPIQYRDFWDVPRIFFTHYRGSLYLFDCPFDDEVEDYPNEYRVYLMPPLSPTDLAGSWADLWERAVRDLGSVPITAVAFDDTKRRQIAASVFDQLPATAVRLSG